MSEHEGPRHETSTPEAVYASLASVFESHRYPRDYVAVFDLSPSAGQVEAARYDPALAFDELLQLTGRQLDTDRPWSIVAGYIRQKDALGLTALSLPLRSPQNNESLLLRRNQDHDYFDVTKAQLGKKPSRLEAKNLIDDEYVDQLLGAVNFPLRSYTTPDDLRLTIARAADKSHSFLMRETFKLPVNPALGVTIERTIRRKAVKPSSPNTSIVHGRQLARRSRHKKGLPRDEFEIELIATTKQYDTALTEEGKRTLLTSQIIRFNDQGYDIGMPTIDIKVDRPQETAAGLLGYAEGYEVKPSPELLGYIYKAIFDFLYGGGSET